MKQKTVSQLRIDAKLAAAAVSELRQGEDLSSFVESSIRRSIDHRRARRDFLARGLASGAEARRTGRYVEASAVLAQLEAILIASSDG